MATRAHHAPTRGARGAPQIERTPIQVVLADDQEMLRGAVRTLLDGEPDLSVIGEASDRASASRLLDAHHPHVLVLELRMDGPAGIDMVRSLSDRAPDTRIVVLSTQESPTFAQRALSAGAAGFVARDTADGELARAVRSAASGEQYLSPELASRLGALHRALTNNKLTQREVEVLRLIALGYTSAEVARKLHLSPRTIETHRAHIHGKLALDNRADLVRYALRRGLIGP